MCKIIQIPSQHWGEDTDSEIEKGAQLVGFEDGEETS